MSLRTDVAPDTLSVDLREEGVEVTYTDGRVVFYRGVPQAVEGSVTCAPGKAVHLLVTDPTETEGVMVYLNDRKTHDEILRSTGVGRVIVDREETTSPFPGVEATNHGHRIEVTADPEVARGRVFVFVEDELSEQSYEIVATEPGAGESSSDGDPAGEADGPDDAGDDGATDTGGDATGGA